jgi:uncharacterized protein (TIGR02757 family)
MRLTGRQIELLERAYRLFHRRACLRPDPLGALYRYDAPGDREIAGLVAAVLAYGRADIIERNACALLDRIDPPLEFLLAADRRKLAARLRGFRHRWTDAGQIVDLLWGVRAAVRSHRSLGESFTRGIRAGDENVLPALGRWIAALIDAGGPRAAALLADPARGSACKRLLMYLRWMVRSDRIDPGLWTGVSPARLVVPVDVHMHRIGGILGVTKRRAADLRTALELTAAFREIRPRDPLRYDFSLTRIGIRGGEAGEAILDELRRLTPVRAA